MFVSLHNHTEYSFLDGVGSPEEWAKTAKQNKMPAIAITDHGNMSGVLKFYTACKEAGVKPIIGCELYVVNDRTKKDSRVRGHIVLLAKDYQGYLNLVKIVTDAWLRGFYYKPRTDFSVIKKYGKGIIGLSACLQGHVAMALRAKKYGAAVKVANFLKNALDEFYLEIQPHALPEQESVNCLLVQMSKDTGIPLVLTGDVHYLKPDDVWVQDALFAIQYKKKFEKGFSVRDCYLRDYRQMCEAFEKNQPEFWAENYVKIGHASRVSGEIAERCNVEIPHGGRDFPVFCDNAEQQLKDDCSTGWQHKIVPLSVDKKVYRDRARMELERIIRMGYANYFLIIADLVTWAKGQGIWVGPARGSVAGCLVAYLLNITDVDPIQHKLYFERFLSEVRTGVSKMPDIDLDFQDDRRDEVLSYMRERWGVDHVASIATFSRMGAKSSLKDCGRIFDVDWGEVNEVTGLIDLKENLTEAYKRDNTIRGFAQKHKKVFALARRIEGKVRNTGKHAAGVVVGREPLINYFPLQVSKGVVSSQWDMDDVAARGLLKIDILGLKNLQILCNAVKLIRETDNPDFSFDNLSFNSKAVYADFAAGKSVGVFQCENAHFRYILREVKPKNLYDVAVVNALVRPGIKTLGQEEVYIEGRKHPGRVKYEHPIIREVLGETYGVLTFQEQVMNLCVRLGGFDLNEADIVRDAVGKKKQDVIPKYKKSFIAHASTILSPECAERWWELIEVHSKYSFNKSHAIAYSMLSYMDMYLKHFYPLQYMTELLAANVADNEKMTKYMMECGRMRIKVCAPDVMKSGPNFTLDLQGNGGGSRDVSRGRILAGFTYIFGIQEKTAQTIVEMREQHGKDFLSHLSKGIIGKLSSGKLRKSI